MSARVVSYRRGTFSYRDRVGKGGDDLLSATRLELLDLDGDGKMEFVTFGNDKPEDVGKTPPPPHVDQWTSSGFQPASASLLETYKRKHLTVR